MRLLLPRLTSRTRRRLAAALGISAALSLAACSAEKTEDAAAATDAAATSADSGPDIGRIAAPGVAFTYRYDFSLPAKAISGVQQQHAAACQQLGTSRCRVTGIRYDQVEEGEVTAALEFLLAPDLAHRFGSEGLAAVERADGRLANAAINGENASDAITLSQQDSAVLAAEITRLEQRLRSKGLTAAERRELTSRIENLRGEQRSQANDRRAKEASLASTPVYFSYASPGLLSGEGSFIEAAAASWTSLQAALSFAMLLAGIALPWLGLLALLVLGWRWLKRRAAPTPAPEA